MGLYINPPTETKEAFLQREGTPIDEPTWPPPEGKVIVCHLDNVMFTAAGVCYSEKEYYAFCYPDSRPRKWFLVDKALLPEVTGTDLPDYFPEFKSKLGVETTS